MRDMNKRRYGHVIGLVFLLMLLLTGCQSNPVLYSEKFVPTAPPQSSFDIYYLERNLTSRGKGNKGPETGGATDAMLTSLGYFDFGQKLVERGPGLLELNGIDGKVRHVAQTDLREFRITNPRVEAGLLILEFTHGKIVTTGHVSTAYLLLSATLLDTSSKKRIWRGNFRSILGNDPDLGILKVWKVDHEFVETTLAMVLEQMSKEGVIKIGGEKVLLPAAKT
jgi:hypothetical protein